MTSQNQPEEKVSDSEKPKLGPALYICLSEKWSSRERSAIRDAEISHQAGYTPIFYVLKDSLLDVKVKSLGYETLYHKGRVHTNFVRWHKLRNLPGILRTKSIQMVHCYELNFIWPMAFFLRGISSVPLFLSLGSEIHKSYRGFFQRTLSSRIDEVFLPFSPLEKNIGGQLGIPHRKVVPLGFGVQPQSYPREKIEKIQKAWRVDEDIWTIGGCVPLHLKTMKAVKPFIYATMGLNQKMGQKEAVRLVLFSENNWNRTLIYPDLIRFVKDLGVEDQVLFYSGDDIHLFQRAVDVWVGISDDEQLEDYTVLALNQGVPALAPRTTSSMELFRLFGSVGETYKRGDARQIRDQAAKLLKSRAHYLRTLEKVSERLKDAFGRERYEGHLLKVYNKAQQVRKRYSQRRMTPKRTRV